MSGRVDSMIHYRAPLTDIPPARCDVILAINPSAALHTMRHALLGTVERGFRRVVNLASVHGTVASREKAAYIASKFGVVGLTRTAAFECGSAGSRATGGVTMNCIAPGFTNTSVIEPQIVARYPARYSPGMKSLSTCCLRNRRRLASRTQARSPKRSHCYVKRGHTASQASRCPSIGARRHNNARRADR